MYTINKKDCIIRSYQRLKPLVWYLEEVGLLAAQSVVKLETPAYVVVGGFGCSTIGYMPFCRELRRRTSHIVRFIGSARFRGAPKNSAPICPHTIFQQAHYVVSKLEGWNLGKVVLVGHSFGVLVALTVAVVRPDLVEKVVAVSPPGAHVDGLRLIGRASKKLCYDFGHMFWDRNRTRQGILWLSAPGFVGYAFGNIVRTVSEGWHASYFRAFAFLYPQVQALGIEVSVFYAEKDVLFAAHKVEAALREFGIEPRLLCGISHDVQFHPKESVQALLTSGCL